MGGDKEAAMSQKSDRKVITKSQLNVERETLLKRLEEGVVIKGIVKSLNCDGARLDLGGVEGVLNITNMAWAWERIKHPSELLSLGDEIQVKALEYDKEKKRVSLGLKQLGEDPWVGVETRYPPGTRVTGKVTEITENGCSVEIEEGIEGMVHITDMAWRRIKHPSELLSLGDEIQVKVLEYDKEKKRVSLGLKQLGEDPWVGVETRYPPGMRVTGKVTKITENGCSVEIEEGFDGFLHIDDIAWKRIKHPSELLSIGDEIQVQVLRYDKEKKQVRLSLKQLDEGPWVEFVRRHPPGKQITGKVTHIVDDKCFVETEEGINGMVRISDMAWAWRQIKHPSELLSKGDEIQVQVLKYDKEKKRVWLGLKQLSEDPWVGVETRYPPGTRITGKVTHIVDDKCFVETEERIEGVVRISDMAWAWERIKHPSELLSLGDEIQVKVLEYDKEKKRVWLGLKQLSEDPWVGVETRYPPGTRVTGKVTKITENGCFVETEEGINGMVHITDMAWRRIKHPSELLSLGDEIQVKVLEYDKEKKRVSLGLKQLGEDPWVGVETRYPPGTRVTGKVTEITENGCSVEIEEGFDGFLHINDIAWKRIKHPSELLSIGDEIQVKVLKYDKEKKQVRLSLKQLDEGPWVEFVRRHPPGKQITGKVTHIVDDKCFVETEERVEGVVRISDMAWRRIKHPSELLSIGDEIQVKVLEYDKEKKRVWLGLKQLSEDPWVGFETRYPPGTRVTGKVTKIADDGCSVEIEEGIEGVVHIDDMAWRRIKHPSELLSLGDEIQVQVLRYNKEKKRVWLGLKQLGEDP